MPSRAEVPAYMSKPAPSLAPMLAIFCDNEPSNFKGHASCPWVQTWIVRAKSAARLRRDAARWEKDPEGLRRSVRRFLARVGIQDAATAERVLGDLGADLDPEAGLSRTDIKLLCRGVEGGLVDKLYLDFDRTLTVIEGVPAAQHRCFRSLAEMLRNRWHDSSAKVSSAARISEVLVAPERERAAARAAAHVFFGGPSRTAALRRLLETCREHGTAVQVLTNNPCVELIRSMMRNLAPKSRVEVRSAYSEGKTKFRVIAEDRSELKTMSLDQRTFARKARLQATKRLRTRADAIV